jgi:hypothetical protein
MTVVFLLQMHVGSMNALHVFLQADAASHEHAKHVSSMTLQKSG